MTKILSILIATMPIRADQFTRLISSLDKQMQPGVQIRSDNSMQYNIGVKRNKLLREATGEYVVFIDDDDEVSPDYIEKILEACKSGADCIGISGVITTNGDCRRQWHISKEYGKWYELNCTYYRTPNHISPVKRELALKAGFPEITFAEDAEYSKRLLPMLKTETKVSGNIYHYKYQTKQRC